MHPGAGAPEEDFDLSQYVNVEDLLDVAENITNRRTIVFFVFFFYIRCRKAQ
jgi:hypothetical protein